jgi:hypothetical protein
VCSPASSEIAVIGYGLVAAMAMLRRRLLAWHQEAEEVTGICFRAANATGDDSPHPTQSPSATAAILSQQMAPGS